MKPCTDSRPFLCWYDIPQFVVPIMISLIEVCC